MKRALTILLIDACVWFVGVATAGTAMPGTEVEVKRAAQVAFDRLRSGDYAALYEALPSTSQRRIPRARFIAALERVRGMYQLDRLQVGGVAVEGDGAAIDTTIYGRVREPVQGEGKIEVRQYLEREGGSWRVITDDASAVRRLLAKQPKLARRFPVRPPRVFVKRDASWVELTPNRARR